MTKPVRLLGAMLLPASLAAPLVFATACEPAYVPTVSPEDASFEIVCAKGCGEDGTFDGVAVDVLFGGQTQRRFAICCEDRADIVARLQVVNDMYCDGLDVPPKRYGNTVVGTTTSQATKKRGATLDQGDGYVAFNCGDWLPELIQRLSSTPCCRASHTAPKAAPPPVNAEGS